jgi:hypothetical protein
MLTTFLRIFWMIANVRLSLAWVPPAIRRDSSLRRFSVMSQHRSAPKGCSVEFTDPETGCQVVLVGCFHGSQSSARDVQEALLANESDKPTNVVVLELCASRFADLRRDSVATKTRKGPWISRFAKMVRQTSEKRGLSTAAAAAVLGGFSGLQTALSGLEPGLEFTTALRYINSTNNTDFVLADQDVNEILNRLGQLPKTSASMWKDFLSTWNWNASSFGKEAAVLKMALFGSSKLKQKMSLPSFLTRNEAALWELARVATPPVILLQTLNLLAGQLLLGDVAEVPMAADLASPLLASSIPLAADAAFILLTYLTVALPATQIILSERDDRLAAGVRSACALAGGTGRVVAVFGFLHVNGVAERILLSNHPSENTASESISTTS